MGEAFISRRNVVARLPRKYLYNLGEEYVGITGGWIKIFNRHANAQGNLIKNVDSMTLESAHLQNTNNCTGAGTRHKINFEGYSKLCFDYDVYIDVMHDLNNTGSSAIVGVIENYPTSNTGGSYTFANSLVDFRIRQFGVGTIQHYHIIAEIDVASISEGYVAFDAWYNDAPDIKAIVTQTIHKVWLEL